MHTSTLHVLNKGSVPAASAVLLHYPSHFHKHFVHPFVTDNYASKKKGLCTNFQQTQVDISLWWRLISQPLFTTCGKRQRYRRSWKCETHAQFRTWQCACGACRASALWQGGWGQMNNALWLVQQRLSTLTQCILYSLCLSLSRETCSIFISSVTN